MGNSKPFLGTFCELGREKRRERDRTSFTETKMDSSLRE